MQGRMAVMLLALLVAACEGEVTHHGDDVVITMLPLTRALVVAVPALVALIGLAVARQKRTRRDGLIMFACTVGVSAVFVPGILIDAVTITPTSIQQPTGLWFMKSPRGFDYAEARLIRIVTRDDKDLPYDVWIVEQVGGGRREINPGDLWEKNSDVIIPLLQSHGVRIERE